MSKSSLIGHKRRFKELDEDNEPSDKENDTGSDTQMSNEDANNNSKNNDEPRAKKPRISKTKSKSKSSKSKSKSKSKGQTKSSRSHHSKHKSSKKNDENGENNNNNNNNDNGDKEHGNNIERNANILSEDSNTDEMNDDNNDDNSNKVSKRKTRGHSKHGKSKSKSKSKSHSKSPKKTSHSHRHKSSKDKKNSNDTENDNDSQKKEKSSEKKGEDKSTVKSKSKSLDIENNNNNTTNDSKSKSGVTVATTTTTSTREASGDSTNGKKKESPSIRAIISKVRRTNNVRLKNNNDNNDNDNEKDNGNNNNNNKKKRPSSSGNNVKPNSKSKSKSKSGERTKSRPKSNKSVKSNSGGLSKNGMGKIDSFSDYSDSSDNDIDIDITSKVIDIKNGNSNNNSTNDNNNDNSNNDKTKTTNDNNMGKDDNNNDNNDENKKKQNNDGNNNNNNNNDGNNGITMELVLKELMTLDKDSLFLKFKSRSKKARRLIANPMDYSTIESKLKNNEYTSINQGFRDDVLLLCSNMMKLYEAGKPEFALALTMKKHFYARMQDFNKPKRSNSKSKKSASRSKSRPKSVNTRSKSRGNTNNNNNNNDNSNNNNNNNSKRTRKQPNYYVEEVDLDMATSANGSSNNNNRRGLRLIKRDGYQPIDDYIFVCDKEYLECQLKTSKIGQCNGLHCHDLTKLGPFENARERWKSDCIDRSKNIECSNECKCDSNKCLNRGMSLKRGKINGRDIKEQKVYGIDVYTRQNLEFIMPENICELMGNENGKTEFIESKLLPTINAYQSVVSNELPQFASKKKSFLNKNDDSGSSGNTSKSKSKSKSLPKDENENKNKNKKGKGKGKGKGDDDDDGDTAVTTSKNGDQDKTKTKDNENDNSNDNNDNNTGVMTRSKRRLKNRENKTTKTTKKYTKAKEVEPQSEDDIIAPFFITDVLRVLLHTAEMKDDWLTKHICSFMLEIIRLMGQDCVNNGYADEYELNGHGRMNIGDPRKLMIKCRKLTEFGKCYSSDDWLALHEQYDPYETLEAYICNTEFAIYTKGTGVVCIRTNPLKQLTSNQSEQQQKRMCSRLQQLKINNNNNKSNDNSNSNDNNNNNNNGSNSTTTTIMDDICSNECGIRKNEFIVEFLGEVYPPWRWYERTDRIKYLERSKGAEQQFDFYNMMLERHNDDENGFNLVFVDPSKKGNYASRISHGCKANCIVTTMATNGKFKIGVFAIRDIKYGEELCFDYNSTTEDEKESKDAICLCGSSICRGSYYYYSGTGAYQDILKIKHHFLHRTASLYKACKEHCDMIENGKTNNNNDNSNSNSNDNSNDNDVVMLNKNDWKWGLSEEEISLFEEHHIGKAVFGENSPKWLITYACEILRYVKLERELLPAELRKQWAEHDWEFEKEWKSERQYKNIRTNYIKSKIQLSKEKEKDNNNNNNGDDNSDITMNEIKQYNLTDDEFKEVQRLEEEYLNKKRNERQEEAIQGANDEAVSVQQSRIQTLVITINRILYFFQNESNNRLRNQAPLIILNEYEIINKLWYESMSPIQQFIQCSMLPENHPIIVNIHNFMNTKTPPPSSYTNNSNVNNNNNNNNNKNDNIITIEESRKLFFWIRDELYKLAPTNTAYHHACADLFHFYGNTKYFFSCNNYSGFTSKPLSYRELGYSKMGNADGKKYGTQYVWGQLSFWERQTIEAPDASLSAQRRGTISIPSIESCYSIVSSHRSNSKSGNKGIGKKYNYKERADLIEWISNENKIGNQWSTKTHWSFRNGKLYGSPWLDYIIDPMNEKNKFENCIKFMKTVNVHYPNGVTTSISSNENDGNNNNNNNNNNSGVSGVVGASGGSVSSSNSSRSMSNSNSNSKTGSVDAA